MKRMNRRTCLDRNAPIGAALLAAVAIGLSTACDGGGGGGGPDGSSTIQGTVDSFSGGGAFYMPREKGGRLEQLADSVIEWFVPSAQAAVGGVTVSVAGTDLSGTTDETGFFILSGVPGGNQTLIFSYNGQTSTLPVVVPDDGLLVLAGVDVVNGNVNVDNITVVENENGNDNGNDDNGNDNGDDDNGNDNG